MIQQGTPALSQLYETDETAWLDAMAELIQQGRLEDLDYPHLQGYLSDMARRDRREVESRLATLLTHMLKWTYQPDHRSRNWRGTIIEQRQELSDLAASGVLRNHAEAVLADRYAKAVARAAAETGLAANAFPSACPYTLEQLLSPDFPADGPFDAPG
ncbi:MAG: DUF29 domain-containing protein [Gemmataceae bacterium]